jgi:hypothetical protein
MEIKELKKLFGNATYFYDSYREYDPTRSAQRRGGGGTPQFPTKGAENLSSAKWLWLSDPKTENLNWIADVFPNLEMIELEVDKGHSLKSLDGLEKLKNLKVLNLNPQFDPNRTIPIDKLNSTIIELNLWGGSLDLSILNKKMNFVNLQGTRVINLEKLKNIECNYLKLWKLKNENDEPLNIEFQGDFSDYCRS